MCTTPCAFGCDLVYSGITVFFPSFWAFVGWLTLVYLGLVGLGVFVFLVFVFHFYVGCVSVLFALEKFQGATRLGATGLRASERKSASERVWSLRGPLKTSNKSLKTSKKL